MAGTREGHGNVLHWSSKHIFLHSRCLALGHVGSLWQNRKLPHSPVRAVRLLYPQNLRIWLPMLQPALVLHRKVVVLHMYSLTCVIQDLILLSTNQWMFLPWKYGILNPFPICGWKKAAYIMLAPELSEILMNFMTLDFRCPFAVSSLCEETFPSYRFSLWHI